MARSVKKRHSLRRIAIVGDGITEKIYFEQLRELERVKGVVIKPELPSKSSKGGSCKKAINAAKSLVGEGYDYVYCLIDFDTVVSENKLANFRQELKGMDNNITVYINNPCFEAWILFHFEKTGKAFDDCTAVEKTITKYLKDYRKDQGYLRRKNLYKILRPHLEVSAIPNATFLEINREEKGDNYPRAEVFKFFLEEKIIAAFQ